MNLYTLESFEEAVAATACQHAERRGQMTLTEEMHFYLQSGYWGEITPEGLAHLETQCVIAPLGFKLGDKKAEHLHYEVWVTIQVKPLPCPDDHHQTKEQ